LFPLRKEELHHEGTKITKESEREKRRSIATKLLEQHEHGAGRTPKRAWAYGLTFAWAGQVTPVRVLS
jgi:hypothetical protein